MAKKIETVAREINKKFEAVNKDYPVAIIRDGKLFVSGETSVLIKEGKEVFTGMLIDYYGEFTGGYPHIDKKLENYLSKIGYGYEWENAGCIVLFDNN